MMLHENRDAFKALISSVSECTDIREDIIEKDYYLTLLLFELSEKQDTLPAYFKGGTALYKAIGRMIRFSEDIDITVDIDNCSNSQKKSRLEKSSNKYHSLPRTNDKTLEINKQGSITSVYEYEPITVIDPNDQLQRFGRVKVEATSFTVSKPYEPLQISALIYSEATQEQQKILETEFGIKPFVINTIQIERIFSDKILAAEFYYERGEYFDTSKHLFDLSVMMEMQRIKNMLSNSDVFIEMISYKRNEERERLGSDLAEKPFSDFKLFTSLGNDKRLQEAFEEMQRIYVFKREDMMDYSDMQQKILALNEKLLTLDEDLLQDESQSPQLTM